MERKALLLFSHQLTENQEKELVENFKVKKIVSLSSELQEMWSNVSIKENYKENLEKIKKYKKFLLTMNFLNLRKKKLEKMNIMKL